MLRRIAQVVDVETVEVDGEPPAVASPEVIMRATRRRFTAEYKARVLRDAAACSKAGEIGALLRREGLYASHLRSWREQQKAGGSTGLDRKRGRKANPDTAVSRERKASPSAAGSGATLSAPSHARGAGERTLDTQLGTLCRLLSHAGVCHAAR
jgi:transposase-like protein